VLLTAGVFGVGLGLSISCGRALASQVLPDPSDGAATGLGTVNVATNVGQALAPAIGALVIGWGGYAAVFVASITFALVAAVPVLLIRSAR
jgi:MFS family permease